MKAVARFALYLAIWTGALLLTPVLAAVLLLLKITEVFHAQPQATN